MADLQSLLSTCTLFQSHMHVAGKLRGVSHCVREDRNIVAKYVAKKSTVFTISSFSKFVFVLTYICKVEIKKCIFLNQ